MERNIRARDRTINQIKAIQNYSKVIDNNATLEALQARVDTLENRYADFGHHEVELLAFDNYQPIAEEVDEIYLDTISKLKAEINKRSQGNKSEIQDLNATLGQFMGQQQSFLHGINQNHNVRLPKFNIEPFEGDYKLWPSFHDLFVTSVHNNKNLNAVHKLQILNGLLKGDAAALIRHIKVTDQNYEEAWTKLIDRYNKPKSIVSSLIQLFLDQKSCTQANHKELRKLCDTSDEVIRGLRALGELAETRDPWLVHILVNKLDVDTKQSWAKESVDDAFPSFENFLKFLAKRCDALESCTSATRSFSSSQKGLKVYNTIQKQQWSCLACKKDHFIYRCPLFKSMNVENRSKIIANSNSCTNCLRAGHLEPQCYSRALCLICKRRHHSLLHIDTPTSNFHTTVEYTNSTNASPTPLASTATTQILQSTDIHPQQQHIQSTSSTNVLITSLHDYSQQPLNILLPTALLYIQANNGQQMLVRALLDSGSQSTFITESCAQRLGLRRNYSRISVYGLAASCAGKTRGKTIITVSSRVIPHYTIKITAHIIDKISSQLPSAMINIPKSNKIWQLELADPEFYKPSSVDLLIGAEFFLDILSEQKLSIPNLPVLHLSKFGWLIAGELDQNKQNQCNVQNYNVNVDYNISNESLMEQLKKFWKIEEPFVNGTEVEPNSNDPCEILYRNTTTRTTDGRFIVKLPFVTPRPNLGNSQINAQARLFGIEKRCAKSAEYCKEYQIFMEDYIQLNQMTHIPWTEIPHEDNQKYFMPHHAVFKESTTTKMRVVFDASCKTTTAVSLNDCLHIGYKLQPDLTTTLLRFRQNIIAINADIEKMYRQILVDPVDANFQLILWRKNPDEELRAYKCNTVTYGTSCAPFLAIRSLAEAAKIYKSKYPEAAHVIQSQFYMDDLLSGSTTVEGAILLKDQINEILSNCGFRLRKWKSNSSEFLQSLERDNLEDIPKLIEDDQSTKTLGIMWYPKQDVFTFKLTTLTNEIVWTKRKMLSESSKLYDPLGWLSPIIIIFKMLLQKLWVTKTEWDEEAPSNILCIWKNIYLNLHYLESIKIPRCVFESPNINSIQLHAFCDASESAYGAVMYIRACNDQGKYTSRLLCSKSKVAPIKQISLPRLELCGAVLLADLLKYCTTIFDIKEVNIYAWTDSMVVLHWLSDIPAKWKTFIANRTSMILDAVPRERWSHVCSNQNPADYITRGVNPKLLPNLDSWWYGPTWLRQDESKWPKTTTRPSSLEVDIEVRKQGVITMLETYQTDIVDQLINNYSSWFKIKKIMGYVLRFCKLPKYDNERTNNKYLSYGEYMSSEIYIVRAIQATSFKNEITKLKKNQPLESNNALSSLDPFLDSKEILRVGGRLKNSHLSFGAKHPIILPKVHAANRLIIQDIHIRNLHAGNTLMLSLLRQKYWIIGARYLIKRYIKSCITCIKYRNMPEKQKLADLPAERCTKNRPFLNTGVDYLGPIYIKASQYRNSALTKAYVAVFICLAVKSVHLEVVSSLSTESFLAALKRFVSRRGLPNQIWCDNGSNFIGANNELQRLRKEIIDQQNHELISNFVLQKGIEFKFNPACAPHFGGLWEAAVKSIKYHFRRVTNEANLNFEETTTLVAQIECLLNSRPLCRIYDDIDSIQILTPGHFLIGESLQAVPEPLLENTPVRKLSRWQNIQLRVQSFWKSWSSDYLNTLQQRFKWKTGKAVINIDDVALVKDDNLPPSQWLLGRVVQLHPGKDGIVRVATIKTATNTIRRPVVKLVLLPINNKS